MIHPSRTYARGGVTLSLVTLLAAFSCGGGQPGKSTGRAIDGARAKLVTIEYGRLVDLYSWQRVDPQNADRLSPANRVPVLVERDVLVNTQVRDEDPFANGGARYRFLPYDPKAGHRDLLILWDRTAEGQQFDRALENATVGLSIVRPYFAFAKGLPTRAPTVPRDATIRLTFDRPLGLDTAFFARTPGAVQVLQLSADPAKTSLTQAYAPVSSRVVSKNGGRVLLVDPEVSGDEAKGRKSNPSGLPASSNNASANIRIALPTAGSIASKFRVQVDTVPQLNGVDIDGQAAVIRDFRAANRSDPDNGHLPDAGDPLLVARKSVGILTVDIAKRVITVNKRFADVVIRGRIPFVDGPYSRADGKPTGRQRVPQARPFESGDVIWQTVISPTGERVRVKAEVLENLDIPSKEGDAALGQGGEEPVARLFVSTVHAVDRAGNQVTFEGSSLPLGKNATAAVHYRHSVLVSNGAVDVGDAKRLVEFLRFIPAPPRFDPITRLPLPPNEKISPKAAVSLSFSKPMDLESIRSENNLVLANKLGAEPRFISDVKVGGLSVLPTVISDLDADATSIRLSTPIGIFHEKGKIETYYVHIVDDKTSVLDRAGKSLDLFAAKPIEAVTIDFKLDKAADNNFVGCFLHRMDQEDEDGTAEASNTVLGTVDAFGQFQYRNGRLYGLAVSRFSRVADGTTLAGVRRDLCKVCWDTSQSPPVRLVAPPLYQTPIMLDAPTQTGGISEPFVAQGSRLQQTYREDDYQLSYREANAFELDVEQLHWAPFIARRPSLITFDLFDNVSIVLGTAEKRPDIRLVQRTQGMNRVCRMDPASLRSGLIAKFEDNYVDNSVRVEVVKNRAYAINPNDAFATSTGSQMIPYPKFSKTYTWRDRRYMEWDAVNKVALGLGGSQKPNDPSAPDRTKSITSPNLPEVDPDPVDGMNCLQTDDYRGDLVQDLSPFALPLLVDLFVAPDDSSNGLAKGDNLFQIGYVGPPYPVPGHGYYNRGWPWLRVHSTGGFDGQQRKFLVDPRNVTTATGGWVNNATLGRFLAPPGDDHVYWGQADFVRRVSVVSFGYIDTLLPGKNEVSGPTGWNADKNGYPNLAAISTKLRAEAFAVVLSPAPERQPLGTSVVVEWRGSEGFDRSGTVYQAKDDETAASRGNLLNPHYVVEQTRYMASGRVTAQGVTKFVEDPDDLLNPKTGLAPRFIAPRLTLVNNIQVAGGRTPFVEKLGIWYKVRKPK